MSLPEAMEPNYSKSAHLDGTINICKGFANTQLHLNVDIFNDRTFYP